MHVIVVKDSDTGYTQLDGKDGNDNNAGTTGRHHNIADENALLDDGDEHGDEHREIVCSCILGVDNQPKKRRSIPDMIPAFGIMMSIFSVVSFSVASLIVKVLTDLHSLEVLSIRCAFQVLFYIVPIIRHRLPIFGVPGHRFDLFLRAFAGTSAAIFIYQAYRLIPLGDATTIQFTAPVVVIFLAVFVLKEPLTWLQFITGIITLGGVIIIARPEFIFGSDPFSAPGRTEGLIFSVIAMLSTATVMLILRKLRTTPIPVVCVWFSTVAMLTSLTVVLSIGQWRWPHGWFQYCMLVAIGILGISDQYFMTIALHYESAGPVAITRTLNIVLAFIWDVTIIGEQFDLLSVVGAIVVSFCIVLLGVCKWKAEKPEQFDRCRRRLCCYCCCCPDRQDLYREQEESDVLIIHRQSSQAYYDSIDDKRRDSTTTGEGVVVAGLRIPSAKSSTMKREESFAKLRDDSPDIVVEKNKLLFP
ncbi:solute carrier family 35 member G1-like [Oppia nitens]|uniref:solute carrier family 35 member G1-like n=1 Tax=Oppia nitens TaxID=1686743 RepID=UPI0023DACC14|nr:solute carrier family 35 member G1-like [Oppia nitens]